MTTSTRSSVVEKEQVKCEEPKNDDDTKDKLDQGSSRTAVVAEWLRRLTRNQIPSGSVGSNPTNCA